MLAFSSKMIYLTKLNSSGLKKVLSGCPTQVDFPAGQVTFQSFCPTGMGPGKLSAN